MASTSAEPEKKKKKDKEFQYEKQADDEETLEQEEALDVSKDFAPRRVKQRLD